MLIARSVFQLPFVAIAVLSLVACSDTASSTTTATQDTLTQGVADAGAGPSVEAGVAPAAVPFPAWKPEVPTLALQGGEVLTAPKFQLVRYASDPGTAPATTLLQKIGASDYWKQTTSEYGVGVAVALPEVVLDTAAPATIDDKEIQAWLLSELDTAPTAGLAMPDWDTAFVWVAPASTSVTVAGSTLCKDIGGYHSTVPRANGQLVPYIVLPQCTVFLDQKGPDALTYALSHELVETATDPRGGGFRLGNKDVATALFWGGYEAGDLCALPANASKLAELGVVVQRTWSNRAASAGHDPCVPAVNKIGYGAFVELPDQYKDSSGTFPSLKMAVGEERTVDVRLFADATGTFTVYALDMASLDGKKSELKLTFANGAKSVIGKNGDTLKLTVHALAPGSYGSASALVLECVPERGRTMNVWAGLVTR